MNSAERNPGRDEARVARWIADGPRTSTRPDREAVLTRTLRQIPVTHQRRRWWRRGNDGAAHGGTRTADDGSPQPFWRSRIMFSATGVTTAVAVVALAAGTLLVSERAAQTDQTPAAAALAEASDAAAFSGTRSRVPTEQIAGDASQDAGVISNRGQVANGITVESSDPRFTGTLDFTMHEDKYVAQGAGVFWGEQVLHNDDGAWQGTLVGGGNPAVGQWRASIQFVGSGAYEGLVALVFFDSDFTHQGVILPGPLPPRD